MFQDFSQTARPEQGPPRLAALRREMEAEGLAGFLVPRADAYQGEYVAPHDDRLAWLTGFTGSAGYCVALQAKAGVFVDSRYRVQVKTQVADVYTPVDWPEVGLAEWIADNLPEGGDLGFDPWLFSLDQIRRLEDALDGVTLHRCDNLVDRIWDDQPEAPAGAVAAQPLDLAGEAHEAKIDRLAKGLEAAACIITLPDSIAWLLNIRGTDIPRNPVPHGFALLNRDGTVELFMDAAKLEGLGDHLGDKVKVLPPEGFIAAVATLGGRVQLDPATCPVVVAEAITGEIIECADPCLLPKARKNAAELEGARAAHLRDGAAMVRFLAWVDAQAPGSFTEIDAVKALEGFRTATNALRDISFETISGSGPNGAIVHYRVTEDTDRTAQDGELLLVDSGGQYVDGTTDITRTIAIGTPGDEEQEAFTRVLKGMIGLSRLRFPKGLAGRDIDVLARAALWDVGWDYGHGTGHGVGSYLSVHEGPARIARSGTIAFEPGMILSNEPGFYREGSYGIRIENLIAVEEAPELNGQVVPRMLRFETLTWVPIDRRLIRKELLTEPERDWLDSYHAGVLERIGPLVEGNEAEWLKRACAPL
ncbi:Xaa-Pro aminopeptidase [Salipiger pallidus]|uniref:Xaa-Pro aminopeptidase n=1 Tax=Salipiger pallidus TaxID=1775170 RepID=A0A8J2ZKU8_9RHOB|nr:aminopeptidase P family protein [Salipiger pallidus]GGG77066.1 Xaa-Pro aminopeptidase [Salipiger pallidus]